MKKSRVLLSVLMAIVLVMSLAMLMSCDLEEGDVPGILRAFNAVELDEEVITQTAVKEDEKYLVTVITADSVSEYTVGADFKIEDERAIVGNAPSISAKASDKASELSDLEKAYDEALKLSGISTNEITGFDFDRDVYMGVSVYKVAIEEVGAKYKYIFKTEDMSLIGSEIEFENSSSGSYIGEAKAQEIALDAAGAKGKASDIVLRSIFDEGKKQYKVSFNYEGFRFDVNVDAVGGDIVKYSRSKLTDISPAVPEIIASNRAKDIALAFVFPDGAGEEKYTFRKVKLDYDDDKFVYEIELVVSSTEYEFEIAARSGDILDVEIDNYENKDEELPQNKQFISREEAIAAVKKVAGTDAYVIEVEIEKEGYGAEKHYYYEVEVRVGSVEREYHVDAVTGEVELYEGESQGAVLSEDEALDIALKQFGISANQITIQKIKLEHNDGRLCYEVKFTAENLKYEVEIDAETGKVLDSDVEREESFTPPAALLTKEQAIAAVKKVAGENATIKEADLDDENGRYCYEIEVVLGGREYEYYVDAETGEVSLNENFVDDGEVKLSEDEALDIAFEFFKVEKSGAEIHKVKLDRDDGKLYYEIEFFIKSLKYEIEIDAETGRIIESDISYD